MTRAIEILLFLAPFVGFGVWRFIVPSDRPPVWLIAGSIGFVALMLIALIWVREQDAADGDQTYVPAQLRDGRVVPSHAAPP
jgi:Family of unknown function (DUF6111)